MGESRVIDTKYPPAAEGAPVFVERGALGDLHDHVCTLKAASLDPPCGAN